MVKVGDVIAKGDGWSTGASTDRDELALGQFADRLHAVERLQLEDWDPDLERVVASHFTSIHVEEPRSLP